VKTKPIETAQPDPVELARADVVRLNRKELELAKRYQSKALELSETRARRGDQVLAAHDPGSAARESSRRITEQVEELGALADAAVAARRQRVAAIPRVFAVEADELERQAAQRDADAAANKASVDEALKEVQRRANCDYVPASELAFARRGQLGGGAGSLAVMTVAVPIFQQRQNEAIELRQRAVQARLKEPHRAGSVEAENLEQLVDIVFADPMRVGPSVDTISGWFEQSVAKANQRRARIASGDDFVALDAAINQLHLEWRAGQIDVGSSWVASRGLAAPGVQVIDTEADFAAAGATSQSA
jgi:hypothetical protein